MPAAKPPVFRRRAFDLVVQGTHVGQVAKGLSIGDLCLRRCMGIGDVNAGEKEGLTSAERRDLAELCRRPRVLEMKLEIPRRASAYGAKERILPKQ